MTCTLHPEADRELREAIAYYEMREAGLGTEFAVEVCAALGRIADHPNAWPVLEGDLRRCLRNRFPYGLIYSIEPDSIFILAVMHLHRDPDYWRQRL